MLFQYQDQLVEVVKERPYNKVLTVMATNLAVLKDFHVRTASRVMPSTHYIYRWMIHISESNLPFDVEQETLDQIEVVDRITTEPISYRYDYSHADLQSNMTFAGGYCWANEKELVEASLYLETVGMIGEPLFMPLFRVPMQLIHSSREKTDGESNPDTDTPN
jgi:hypothetical protein